ncbi:unnamed protein product, partial [Meganyctiphanes norvegica]
CELWCQQEDGVCLLREVIISPSYEEKSDSNVQTCYTKRIADLSTEVANIYGSPNYGPRTTAVKENLVDGFQSVDDAYCYVSDYRTNPFVMFDLGMEKLVHEFHIFPGRPSKYFGPLEFRIGQSKVTNGDFSSYKLFGQYSGDAQSREEVVITPSEPVRGRYISVQQIKHEHLWICHIEIF